MQTGMNKFLFFAGVLIISTACSTSYKMVDIQYKNNEINELTDSVKDPSFTQLLSPYKDELSDKMAEIISWSDTSLVSYKPESPLSNFISDLLLENAEKYVSENQPGIQVDFSLINHGGLRTSLPKGKITVLDIFELMPFENEMVLLKLTGSQVSELADYIASRGGEGVSGISFGIQSGNADSVKIQNKPLDLNSTYWLVTHDYLANGGSGMKILSQAGQKIITGAKIRDVIIGHLKNLKLAGQTVSAKTDRRIYRVE
jgi:2',3'-cyclic-nucleotide 2'-phosphodiesterase (5'-nucleotidase family)